MMMRLHLQLQIDPATDTSLTTSPCTHSYQLGLELVGLQKILNGAIELGIQGLERALQPIACRRRCAGSVTHAAGFYSHYKHVDVVDNVADVHMGGVARIRSHLPRGGPPRRDPRRAGRRTSLLARLWMWKPPLPSLEPRGPVWDGPGTSVRQQAGGGNH